VASDVSTFAFSGTAADSDGSVASVRWRIGTGAYQIATGTTSWSFAATPLAFGTNVVEVQAVDNAGATSAVASRTITRQAANVAPTITITAPSGSQTVASDVSTFAFSGTAADSDGSVATVRWRIGTGAYQIATGTTSWSFTVDPLAVGANVVEVQAVDNAGALSALASRTITRQVGNVPPVINITSPASNQVIPFSQTSQTFLFTATDSDGTVANVDYAVGTGEFTQFGLTVNGGTWQFTWTNLVVGVTEFRIRARDNSGAETIVTRTITRQPADTPAVLPSTWYFAEGATLDFLQTFILMANPSNESRQVRMDLLYESRPADQRLYDLPPNSRVTVDLNSLSDYSGGLSTVLTEVNGLGFAAERAMYVRFGNSGKWNAAHAAVGSTAPQASWFFPEGSSGLAGPAGAPFQTFILLANPSGSVIEADLTYFPEGEASFVDRIPVPAFSRVTVEPGARYGQLNRKSFSTRVTTVGAAGILAERAMWWSDPDWTRSPFMGGHASPGLPSLSNNWYFAEGDTRDSDDFILFVNPGSTAANITVDYLLPTSKVTRTFTVGANSRKTVNVTYDGEGLGGLSRTRHGTTIRSSQPIAVERSIYWSRGRFGWVDGNNSLAAPQPSTKWLLPEGATVPVAVGSLRTEILLANPSSTAATIQLRYLLEGRAPFTQTVTLGAERAMTIVANDIPELASSGFATEVTATVPIVVERSMYFDTNEPEAISRVGGTCSMGIPLAPTNPTKDVDALGAMALGSTVERPIPTPTPTPTVTPVGW
jgi:hypothetical protein